VGERETKYGERNKEIKKTKRIREREREKEKTK